MGEPIWRDAPSKGDGPFADGSSFEIEKGRAQMNTSLRSIVVAALVGVINVHDVSGFTRSDTAGES